MQCPKCHGNCPPEFDFCPRCATALHVTCPQCGFRAPADFKFCPKCATALPWSAAKRPAADAMVERLLRQVPKEYAERLLATRGQPHDERRTVTILFSDIKGSTAMAANLDPEDAKEIILGAFEFLIAPIYRYEGTLVQLMGDAILAFFGAPIAHEDDPERACRAALEITTEAAEYAEKLRKERGIEGFDVRVGINTGLVVVGEVGSDLRVAYTAIGDAINLAARMEQNAEPGTVLITEATHKLIAPLFETQAMAPLQVKGKAELVQTYRVLAAKAVAGKVRGIVGLESPLVGRESEFTALREAIERLQAGVGGIVTIVGEAGLGKSRLVAEVRNLTHVIARPPTGAVAISAPQERDCFAKQTARRRQTDGEIFDNDRQLEWVEGRCLSYGTSIAYLLWLDVLRDLLGVTLDDAPEKAGGRLRERAQALCPDRFEDVYPYLARLMSLPLSQELQAKLDDMDGQGLKEQTFAAVETLLECASRQRPIPLVCEDLHWADSTSLQLLQALLPLTTRAPLLCIALMRPVKDHGSWQLREAVAAGYPQTHTDLTLEPLSAEQSQALVANLLRVEDLGEALRERILGRAEGNPFYVEEVIRSLIDRGAIVRDAASGHWQATSEVATLPIPDTLQGVLMARIDRLQEETRRVLQMAAVIGRIFLYRVLAEIAAEQRRLDDRLATLQHEEMIRERARLPELEYIFKHDLTREAAYNGLLKKERRALHRQVAEALERLFPERIEEWLGLLAYHWEGAQNPEKASGYLLRAGDQARLAFAHPEAIAYYQRALVFLQGEGEQHRAAQTWMKLGLTYHTVLDFHRSQQAYDEGFGLWQLAEAKLRQIAESLPPAPHPFRLPNGEPPSLDPAGLGSDIWVTTLLFSSLLEMRPDADIVPDAAYSWEVLEGGRKYVFHLRDDVRWTDGVPVTAADWECGLRRLLEPASQASLAESLYDIQGARAFHQGQVSDWTAVGARAADDLTLVIELERPAGYFLQLMPFIYAVPRHRVEALGQEWAAPQNIVTNGPFTLQASEPGRKRVFERNKHHHGAFRGNLQQVEMHLMPDVSDLPAMVARYAADELDLCFLWTLSPAERERALQRHASDYHSFPVPATYMLIFAANRSPFADHRVRQALVQALDRETLGGLMAQADASPAVGGLVPPGMPGHSAGIALPHDPTRARTLLAEAGFPGGRGFPPVVGLTWEHFEPWAEYMGARWQEILGVAVSWRVVPLPQLLDALQDGSWDLSFYGFQCDYYDPDSFMRSSPMRRWAGWHHDTYERLVEEARGTLDQARRLELYRAADQILVQEAAIVPLAHPRDVALLKPWLRMPAPAGAGGSFPWKDLVIEPH